MKDPFAQGKQDFEEGSCIVYKTRQGDLVWDTEDDRNIEHNESVEWADAYIRGWQQAAGEDAAHEARSLRDAENGVGLERFYDINAEQD